MKISHHPALRAACLTLGALTACTTPLLAESGSGSNGTGNGKKATDPIIPVGSLSAFPRLVQTGTHPELTWEIQFPDNLPGFLSQENVCQEVRVVGVSNDLGIDSKGKVYGGPVQAEIYVDGVADWTLFFYGGKKDVSSTWVYASSGTYPDRPIRFRARSWDGYSWRTTQTSGSTSGKVLTLYNGTALPTSVAAFQNGEIEPFLKPYVDDGGNVTIGPKDMLVLFELDDVDAGSPGSDYQDLVLLVTYDLCKNNNGHGNNLDGVDVSNPGNAPFKEGDPSGPWDDETKGGGAYPSIDPGTE